MERWTIQKLLNWITGYLTGKGVDSPRLSAELLLSEVLGLERIELYVNTYQDRFWTEQGGSPPFNRPYKENFRKYFSSIYFDLAGFEGGMNAVECALTTISPQRLLFGTDYPYNFTNDPQGVRNYIESIRNLDLSTLATERILGGNAAELLGI